jgi:hypothetical protein
VPGPEPPVVNGLQIDQSLDFQRRFRRVRTVAWRVLALLPVAAVPACSAAACSAR